MELGSIRVDGFEWTNGFGLTLPPLVQRENLARMEVTCKEFLPLSWSVNLGVCGLLIQMEVVLGMVGVKIIKMWMFV